MPLTDSLISYWSLDEASGNALDAHSTNHLTETSGTIGSATGKVGNCRDFEVGDTEHFLIADNASLSTGDIDFTLSAWVNPESLTGANMSIAGKFGGAGSREYMLRLGDTGIPVFSVSNDGTVSTGATSSLGALTPGTWYFIVGWHDSVNNQIGISVNGTVVTANYTLGVFDSTAGFSIGALSSNSQHFDGLIDEVGFWKRVLTSDERATLYNNGNGLAYPLITSMLQRSYPRGVRRGVCRGVA